MARCSYISICFHSLLSFYLLLHTQIHAPLLCCAFCSPPACCSIGETVEEVNDSGFNGNVPTLQTQLLADDSMLQVC